MGVLGDEAFRWELDENRWESLLCDDVPLGVDELGVGEFRDTEWALGLSLVDWLGEGERFRLYPLLFAISSLYLLSSAGCTATTCFSRCW